MSKVKPCAEGRKHKWEWVRNRIVASLRITAASFTLRGLYKCSVCGDSKYGEYRHVVATRQEGTSSEQQKAGGA